MQKKRTKSEKVNLLTFSFLKVCWSGIFGHFDFEWRKKQTNNAKAWDKERRRERKTQRF